ncbi:MAG: hypothetical protein ACI82F_000508 [Planctomycetota bacterium]|jgi:hypothetical protein
MAMAMAVATWRVWWVAENRSASDLLDAAESRLERDSTDHNMTLRELGLALQVADENGDTTVAQQALLIRAEVNMQRRNFSLVLVDCVRVLGEFASNNPEALRLATRASFASGELQGAVDFATILTEVQGDKASSHNLLANIHRTLAEDALGELFENLNETLPTRKSIEGLNHARRAAALTASNPHALSALEGLDDILDDAERSADLRILTERARAHFAAARRAWIAALAVGRNGESIRGIQEQFSRAGLYESMVSLGRSALSAPNFPGAGAVLVSTALAQADLGRIEDARKLISGVKAQRPNIIVPNALDKDTILRWVVLLHELELWKDLELATQVCFRRRYAKRDDRGLRTSLSYLLGVSLLQQNRTQAAMPSLSRAGRYTDAQEFVPGEQVLSWYTRATAERRMAMRADEQRSILEVTRVRAVPEPDGGRAARAFGDSLERQAKRAERNGDPAIALELLAQSLAYLPERRIELEGRWRRMGEHGLASQGRTLQEYEQLFAIDDRQREGATLNSWATVEIARNRLEYGRATRALSLIRRSLERLPYFPPLLEVAGDAYAADEDWSRAISAWLTLGELYGYTPELATKLRAVPRDQFPTEKMIKWAALDPRSALLSGMVRDLAANNQPELALQAIHFLGGKSTSPEEYLLGADLSAVNRNWKDTYDNLMPIEATDPLFPQGAALLVRSAVELGKARQPNGPLRLALVKVLTAPNLNGEGFAEAIDALFGAGLTLEAAALGELLTEGPASRDPSLLLRRAVADVSLRDTASAELALDRAEAYEEAGEVLVGRLLLATDTGDEAGIQENALKLILGPFKDSPFQRGIVRILYGDLERALPLLAAADQETEGLHFPTRLAFLTGLAMASEGDTQSSTGNERLDRQLAEWRLSLESLGESIGPKHILTLLLALSAEPWQGWASTRLLELSSVLGRHNWARLLAAYNIAALGRLTEAKRLLRPLTRPKEQLPWSWVLLEQIALEESGGEINFDVVRARVGRVLAIGNHGLDPTETPNLVAEVLVFLDRPGPAQRVLEVGLRRLEGNHRRRNPLLVGLARTARVTGDLERSLWSYEQRLLAQVDGDFAELTPEFIELMEDMRKEGSLTGSAMLARLEALAARFPQDPAPVRAIAGQLLASGDSLSASPVSRALARLSRFRTETRGIPLDKLRRGEAAKWTQMIATMDPQFAVTLAYEELLFAPYSVELWRTWADALRDSRHYEEALGVFRILAAIVPDLDSMKSLAQILMEGGNDPLLALAAASQARLRLAPGESDPELELIEGVALITSGGASFDRGAKLLRRLLEQAQQEATVLDAWRAAQPLVENLFSRGTAKDLLLAIKVSDQVATDLEEEDTLRADWFRAMSVLSSQKATSQARSSRRQ